jgi:pimeloyl-ACP methyl ester carboxylesterase
MPFAELGDVRMFYTDDNAGNDGIPLLLVHGLGADSDDWIWHLPALAKDHRVIAPDLRGHGHTSAPAAGYRPRELAGDLLRLLDHLGVERVIAVGHSLGTLLVSILAVEHPDRIQALVCVDPGYGQPTEVAAGFPKIIEAMRRDPYQASMRNEAWCHTPASPPYLRTWHDRKILATAPVALADGFAGMYTGDDQFGLRPAADAYLARRECPVLSLWSAVQTGSAEWEAGLFKHPASRSVAWPGGGHRLHEERPAEFLLVMDEWLKALNRRRSPQ